MKANLPSTKKWFTPVRITALGLLSLGVFVSIAGSLYDKLTIHEIIEAFFPNAGTELISIALTVLVIDSLNEQRATKEEKSSLILQMGSPNNIFAIEAVRILRLKGWLTDGTLAGASLYGANLQDADLDSANLKGVNLSYANLNSTKLRGANLQNANLRYANLESALLSNANLSKAFMKGTNFKKANLDSANLKDVRRNYDEALAQAYTLKGAIMPNGNIYSGKYNLEEIKRYFNRGLFSEAELRNPQEMAKYYEVSVEDYLEGQKWAQQNADLLKQSQNELYLGDWLNAISDDA